MFQIEEFLISFLLNFFARAEINAFLRDPQNTATIIGSLIAISGALLGTFLLLQKSATTFTHSGAPYGAFVIHLGLKP